MTVLSDMLPLERDEEEAKKGKGLKMLTSNLETIYIFFQHNKITKNVYSNLIKSLYKILKFFALILIGQNMFMII